MIGIRVTPAIEKRLDRLAKKTGRTKTFYVRMAILEYLDDLEDMYLAEKRVEDIRSGKVKPISSEEMSARLGLDD
ncbi:MAG: TraY domain-containing protein [Nitrospinae bacterium]|nr:TraY domain-containing protein [Nitrospinota bacterium]